MDLNCNDLQYQCISSDLKNTFNIININNYYEADLIASAFDKHYERYRINGDKNKELSLDIYLDTVRKNVAELINKKNIGEYPNNEKAEKYTCSDNVELRTTDYSNIITTTLYNSLLKKYQETLENKMQGSSFVFHYVNFLDINFSQIDLIRTSSYIQSPKWVSNKKATINP